MILLILLGRPVASARADEGGSIVDFQTVSPRTGWLLFGNGLFWTAEDGGTWDEITPPLEEGEAIKAVWFADASLGRVLLADGIDYRLAVTEDGGASWQLLLLDLPGLADTEPPPAASFMGWRSADHGWLVLKVATGSSFSVGKLYVTVDGGITWQPRTVPLGEAVAFSSENAGWVAGGPAGDELYRTLDGGRTWELRQPAGGGLQYLLPEFEDEQRGLLPVVAGGEDAGRADFYLTGDGGTTWSLAGSQTLRPDTWLSGDLPLSILDSANFVLTVPQGDQILRTRGLQLETNTNVDGASAAVRVLRMASLDDGWGLTDSGSCAPATAGPDASASGGGLECSRETTLLSTHDGGVSWQVMPLPSGGNAVAESFGVAEKVPGPDGITALDSDTQWYGGQGFDMCRFPTVSSMQTWWNSSPYNGFNLYIGGSKFACRSLLYQLTPSYVSALSAQGWRFFPTWVGPQAPCMSGTYGASGVFSYNTTTAYNQGVAEADAALAVATSLGLAAPNQSGTVIYYDLETYYTETACRNAANSFISGWTSRLRARGNLAGVYGNAYYNAADWWNIANRPDAVWLAQWYSNPAYRPTASVWDVSLPSSLWANHQRLRQYAGSHYETWGGTTLGSLDSNVLDGPVTVANGTGNTTPPSVPIAAIPLPGANVVRNNDTWLTWKTTGDTCYVHVWGNGIDLASNGICSIYHLGVRPPGTYSWQVTAYNAVGSTVGPVWQFGVAPNAPGTLSAAPAGPNAANLTWVLSSDDPAYVDGYRIYANGALAGSVARGVNTFRVPNLICNTTYNFRVTATWSGAESGPSTTATLGTPNCPPTLLTPEQGASLPNLRPTFTWQAVGGSNSYTMQVSSSVDFSILAINATAAGTSYTPSSDLLASTLHYWRARSNGSSGSGEWSATRTFTTGNPPSTPGLISPAENALQYDYTPLLDWSDATIPSGKVFDHYQVQVATSARFNALLYNQGTAATDFTVPSNLLPNSEYYWRVRAFDTGGHYSSWGGPWSFRAAMLPPVPNIPGNWARLPTVRLTFDWSDVAGASGYRIQVSNVADFSTLVSARTVAPSTYEVTSDLPANTLLYWRVRATGTNGPSWWSQARRFTTGNPPSVPSLLLPDNGALLTNYQPTLDWGDSVAPSGTTLDHYQVQLARDSIFSAMLYDEAVNLSDFSLPAPLSPNACYHWRVRSFNTGGHYSSWAGSSFCAAILPPTLSLPSDGQQLGSPGVTFDWSDVLEASGYDLQISSDPAFGMLVQSASKTGSSHYVPSGLPANALLYWRVRTNGAHGPSAWSQVRSFKTANPPSTPSLLWPDSGQLLRDYQPTLEWADSTIPPGTRLRYYRLQVSTNASFTDLVHNVVAWSSSYRLATPLGPDRIYYWRVRAINTDGHYSFWSSLRSFRAAIPPPVLLWPAEAQRMRSASVSFDWGDVAGASGYDIQISDSAGFANILRSASRAVSTYYVPSGLPANALLYWRVQATGANGPSLWSGVRSFTTANPPSTPAIVWPANDSLVRIYQPTLDWADSTIPLGTTLDHYRVQVAADLSFTAMVYNTVTTGSSFPVPAALQPNRTYYWRVRAYSAQGHYSFWSSVGSFRTAILSPTLLAPSGDALLGTRRPVFDWANVSGASGYTIQVSRVNTFSTTLVSANVTNSAYTPGIDLPTGVALYWRVRATGPNGPSRWAEVPARTFTIILP
jgi:hypothetical protein